MPVTQISDLTGILGLTAKIIAVFAFGLYLVFALVVIQQVRLMSKTVKVNMEIPIYILVFIHLLFAIGVFLLALLIL